MSLRSLSDQQILSDIQKLTRRERSITLQVLLHFNEIERRRLHLKLGYSSMFDYCTSGLGYSASAASRRIRTARCVARFPEVYDWLDSNEVNVSTIAQVSRILSPANKDEVLARIRGKSQREVEAVVAHYEPLHSVPRDRVRTVVVRVPAPAMADAVLKPVENGNAPVAAVSAAVAETAAPPSVTSDTVRSPAAEHNRYGRADETRSSEALERRALLRFSASDAFMVKLERVRSLVWHELPNDASLEQVFELALDFILEKKDPIIRQARREEHANQKEAQLKQSTKIRTNPRHFPAATRDKVHVRDRGQCTFVSSNGRRCASTRALQIDHVKPVAFGGAGTPGNLRLLCAYHNRIEAERQLGDASRHYARDG